MDRGDDMLLYGGLWDELNSLMESLTDNRLADVSRTVSFIPGEGYGPHQHLRVEINYVSKGTCCLFAGGARYSFHEGDTMILAPHHSHRFKAGSRGTTLIQLEFLPEIARSFNIDENRGDGEASMELSSSPVLRIRGDIRIRETLQTIICELDARKPGYRYTVLLNYAQLILLILRHRNNLQFSASAPPLLAKTVRSMQLHIADRMEITDFASAAGVSDSYLRRIFRRHLGMSPNEYLLSLRLAKARELLIAGDMSVKEVCYACGFSTPQYFSRVFKSEVGSSPAEYMVKNGGFRKVL